MTDEAMPALEMIDGSLRYRDDDGTLRDLQGNIVFESIQVDHLQIIVRRGKYHATVLIDKRLELQLRESGGWDRVMRLLLVALEQGT